MWGRDAHVVLPLAPHLSLRVPREARQSSSCWRMILRACSGMSAGRVAKGRRGGRCGTWTYETARWQRVGRGPAHPAARKEGGGGIAGGWREAGPTLVELACAPRECCSLAGSCARKLPAEGANHGLPAVSKAVPSRVRCADPGIGGCPNLPVSDSPLCNRSRDQMPAAMGGGWFQLVSSPFQLFPILAPTREMRPLRSHGMHRRTGAQCARVACAAWPSKYGSATLSWHSVSATALCRVALILLRSPVGPVATGETAGRTSLAGLGGCVPEPSRVAGDRRTALGGGNTAGSARRGGIACTVAAVRRGGVPLRRRRRRRIVGGCCGCCCCRCRRGVPLVGGRGAVFALQRYLPVELVATCAATA